MQSQRLLPPYVLYGVIKRMSLLDWRRDIGGAGLAPIEDEMLHKRALRLNKTTIFSVYTIYLLLLLLFHTVMDIYIYILYVIDT